MITVITDKRNDGSLYSFSKEEICLELNDFDDNGKIFTTSF
jgi:hypothetical protein